MQLAMLAQRLGERNECCTAKKNMCVFILSHTLEKVFVALSFQFHQRKGLPLFERILKKTSTKLLWGDFKVCGSLNTFLWPPLHETTVDERKADNEISLMWTGRSSWGPLCILVSFEGLSLRGSSLVCYCDGGGVALSIIYWYFWYSPGKIKMAASFSCIVMINFTVGLSVVLSIVKMLSDFNVHLKNMESVKQIVHFIERAKKPWRVVVLSIYLSIRNRSRQKALPCLRAKSIVRQSLHFL